MRTTADKPISAQQLKALSHSEIHLFRRHCLCDSHYPNFFVRLTPFCFGVLYIITYFLTVFKLSLIHI